MPNTKLENFKIGADNHLGRKLTDAQKEDIRLEFAAGGVSKTQLAKRWGVSRRLIGFILDPETLQANRERGMLRGNNYNKQAHRDAMRKHRQRKWELMKMK